MKNYSRPGYWRWHMALLVTTVLLTLLDYILLRTINAVMVRTIPGYMLDNVLVAPMVLTFLCIYFLNYRGIIYGWQRIAPYVIYGTAIFFPLIFITSLLRFLPGLPADLALFYRREYCPETATASLCGPALAHMVFCWVMRTLPLLIILPVTFYGLLKINFLGVATPYGSTD